MLTHTNYQAVELSVIWDAMMFIWRHSNGVKNMLSSYSSLYCTVDKKGKHFRRHYSDVTRAPWCLKSHATNIFCNLLFRTIKGLHYWPLVTGAPLEKKTRQIRTPVLRIPPPPPPPPPPPRSNIPSKNEKLTSWMPKMSKSHDRPVCAYLMR